MPGIDTNAVAQLGIGLLVIWKVFDFVKPYIQNGNGKKNGNGKYITKDLCKLKHDSFEKLVEERDTNLHHRLNEMNTDLKEIKQEIRNGNGKPHP